MGDSNFIFGGGTSVFKIGGSGGVDVGFTSGGVRISRSLTPHLSEVDQQTAHLKARTTMNEMFIRTEFAEASLENIAYAWNISQGSITASSLQVIDSSDEEQEVYIQGPGPEDKTRTVDAYRCFAQGDMEMGWGRDEDMKVAVEFRVLLDATKSPARFMDMSDA